LDELSFCVMTAIAFPQAPEMRAAVDRRTPTSGTASRRR
jgi:hypothetical protein